jgi:hypothetical protein
MADPQQKRRRGCLFYGGIAALVLIAVMLLGAYLGLRFARDVVSQLTDATPMQLPSTQLPPDQMLQLHDRVETFQLAVRAGDKVEPLELSADELNALIATDPDLAALKNHIYVTIETNQLEAQISFPAQDIGLVALRGRYVNASGFFAVALTNGQLSVTAESLVAKGRPVPRHVMREITSQNLADIYNADPKVIAGLKKLQGIEVEEGKLVIEPKK